MKDNPTNKTEQGFEEKMEDTFNQIDEDEGVETTELHRRIQQAHNDAVLELEQKSIDYLLKSKIFRISVCLRLIHKNKDIFLGKTYNSPREYLDDLYKILEIEDLSTEFKSKK